MRKFLFLGVLLILTTLLPAEVFDDLAIQDRGRKKPFSSFAHEMSLYLSGKSPLTLTDRTLPPLDFVLELWLDGEDLHHQPVILVDYLPLRQKLGLEPSQKRFSYVTLESCAGLEPLQREAANWTRLHPNEKLSPLLREVNNVVSRLATFRGLTEGNLIKIVPHPSSLSGPWTPLPEVQLEPLRANFKKDRRSIWPQIEALIPTLRTQSPSVYPTPAMLALEATYLKSHPWRWAWIAYALGAVLMAATFHWQRGSGYRVGYALVLLGFLFQIYGFVCRIIISGRPPVTNMYESIVWVAFGTVLIALILEAIYRSRYFVLAAAPVAVAALIFTDLQPAVFDRSIQPLVAVLNNNYWLTIHVLTITLSYGAFALALGLGHVALIQLWRGAKEKDLALLYQYNYRALQVGILLLAAGTILGGVWANYSWGRFWDWDPKETWALIALLTYLVILHGRMAGWWGGFGLAVGSVLCFQSVLMAWYGVNFVLGAGLHSYGFGSGGLPYAATFVAMEFLFVASAVWKFRQLQTKRQALL